MNGALVLATAVAGALNILPLAPAALALALLAVLAHRRPLAWPVPVRRLVLAMAAYAVLWLAYAASTGVSLLDPDLYRREAKFLLPFAAFMLSAQLQPLDTRTPQRVGHLLTALALASLLFLALSLGLIGVKLPMLYPLGESMWEAYDGGALSYSGQFMSHSAAGGFFATLYLLLFGLARHDRQARTPLLWLALVGVGLILVISRSRAFLIAATAMTALSFVLPMLRSRAQRIALITAVLVAAVLVLPTLSASIEDATPDDLAQGAGEISEYNVTARLVLWGIALTDFVESPLIGVGASRFDDERLVLATFPTEDPQEFADAPLAPNMLEGPGLRVNVDSYAAHTDQHAHNLYLHALAEGGLIGLGALLAIIWLLDSSLREARMHSLDARHAALLTGARYALGGVLIGSMFGNNFLTIIPMQFYLAVCASLLCCGRAPDQS